MQTYRVGIDIGGTFTDLVALADDGQLIRHKVASTPQKLEDGLLNAFRTLLADVPPENVAVVAHASTIATNALLGQVHLELPRVAFVTTEGFRDVLEIGRQNRSAIYDLGVTRPKPLARREDRLTVRERRGHDGGVIVALDRESVDGVVATLREREISAIAVGLLHSDIDGSHERSIAAAIAKALPDADISLSSEIDPQYREYERFSTTVVNAALLPILRAYLDRVASDVAELGVHAPIFVMRSDGGMSSLATAAQRPATLIESGPASGVIGAAYIGRALGLSNVLSFDMGGTTAKAGTIFGGVPEVSAGFEAAGSTHSGRSVKGSGYPVRFPFVDLAEVSAGGGTIAYLDAAQTLRVGPLSAGADPGPACYGRGERPTVTDANVVLGRLNPRALLDGAFPIHADRARHALETVAAPLDGDVERTAAGIVTLVDAEMAKVLRIVSVERGHDPRDFTILAFGGGGPLHACAVAEEIGVSRIVIPSYPGVFSAYGLLAADVRAVAVRSVVAPANATTWERVLKLFEALAFEADTDLADQAVAKEDRTFTREVDLRYLGQSTDLTVTATDSLEEAVAAFHRRHEQRYGFAALNDPVEIATVRIVACGATPKPRLIETKLSTPRDPLPEAHREERLVHDGRSYVLTPVYARAALRPNDRFAGPAVVEEYDATTYIGPHWSAHIDAYGNLVLEHAR
ncbi:MAG TPA: hydantoinase/oxoprolinase family protein [Candidatus Baltobacteraceae bacterium]|nr:hydantoinase/oxoprolinase family protein [Candidatus Baltobacteraceae bacterium]